MGVREKGNADYEKGYRKGYQSGFAAGGLFGFILVALMTASRD